MLRPFFWPETRFRSPSAHGFSQKLHFASETGFHQIANNGGLAPYTHENYVALQRKIFVDT